MIIEQHYDDEVLIDLLDEADEDSHVPSCETCSGTLESYRDLSAALHDDSVWEERELPETPSPKTANFLRAFAERTRAEDVAAGPIVAKLVADPSAIEQHPEWRTAGVVRGLLKVAAENSFTDPQAILRVTKVAVDVADSLGSVESRFRKLRASAWHEHGYALYAADRFAESLNAYNNAEELLEQDGLFEFDIANVTLHRTQVLRELEEFDEALAVVRRVRSVFDKYGAKTRVAAAEATEAAILYRVGRFEEALPVFQRIAGDSAVDETSRALALHNAAEGLAHLSRFDEARVACVQAIAEFERLRLAVMRTRARWVLARILVASGSCEQALPIFDVAKREFEESGLHQEVALIGVDTAEALWTLGRTSEVPQHCQDAIEAFARVDLTYSEGARTAFAYLKEAAEGGTFSKAVVKQVRGYLETLPKQPQLLFASPL